MPTVTTHSVFRHHSSSHDGPTYVIRYANRKPLEGIKVHHTQLLTPEIQWPRMKHLYALCVSGCDETHTYLSHLQTPCLIIVNTLD